MEPPAFVLASEPLSLAFFVAREAHAGQTRGGGGRPYLDHPVQVAELLHEQGAGEPTIVAGLLHDVVEDSGLTVGDVVESFGVEVGELVVDDYLPVVDGIENDIEEVEAEIFSERADSTQRIYFLKREVIEFHRAVFPLLSPLHALERGAFPNMDEQLRRYFRDVADHARRVDEQVTGQRELLTSILEANLALLSVKQNEVVRTISAWAAIIAVPTFLASIWGMNFAEMPELDEAWGYPLALALMVAAITTLHRFFRRIHWL